MSAPDYRALQSRAGEFIVPVTVLIGCFLFWYHIQDARSAARRVPNYVIIFTVTMTGLVLLQRIRDLFRVESDGSGNTVTYNLMGVAKATVFIFVCILYYFAFDTVGFNTANLVFLLVAYPLAGLPLSSSVIASIVSSVAFFGLAKIMEFNVPLGPLGI